MKDALSMFVIRIHTVYHHSHRFLGEAFHALNQFQSKIKNLKNCTFFRDNFNRLSKVLAKNRHVIGKKSAVCMERDNTNTRHCIAHMIHRTNVVLKKKKR